MAKVIGESATTIGSPHQVVIQPAFYFACGIYNVMAPQHLDMMRKSAKTYLDDARKKNKLDKTYPVVQSDNMFADPKIQPFTDFIAGASHQILASQGYEMTNLKMVFTEMWAQEHQPSSGHEEHMHSNNQISGFYFLDVPKDGPKIVFHDPKSAKVYATLPETDNTQATLASNMINYTPEPGMFIFTNSWLPHTIQRNPTKQPLKLIHFNLTVTTA
jgi:uncharacterized protein (TIGR02466 family)